jgi:dienelactone hydrolase
MTLASAASRLLATKAVRRLAGLVPGGVRDRIVATLGLRAPEEPAIEALRSSVERQLRCSAIDHDRAWRAVRTPTDWESFRDARIEALRRSLGPLPQRRSAPLVSVTGKSEDAGVIVESLRYAGRPATSVTADLYRPADSDRSGPGILICHSHHCDRTQGELRDMGVLWAQAGCTVLIPDLIGHGQRRLHPFDSDADYHLPFKARRQDYYFRYNLGLQLDLAGHSLLGWMVGDLLSSFDVLLDRPGVDADRTVLIGSVAGGGDVAAVTAALEPRIACLVGFNYRTRDVTDDTGGPVPSPGEGSWESTRNLRRSACDGFFPWVVLAACAPRRLIYAHEFSWNAAEDAQWRRLRQVYGMYDTADRLVAIHGRGSADGPLPFNTHCTNVGAVHRRELHPLLADWFAIPQPDESTTASHRPAVSRGVPVTGSRSAVLEAALETATAGRRTSRCAAPELSQLRDEVASLLGIDPGTGVAETMERVEARDRRHEVVTLCPPDGPEVELTLVWPAGLASRGDRPLPVVLACCQHGWRAWRRGRRKLVNLLLRSGIAVCATDLRGTGPRDDDHIRGRHGAAAAISSSELMLGRTLLGGRITDLLAALAYVRGRREIDAARVLLWGDSLAPANPPAANLAVPFDAGPSPRLSEPLGGLAALIGALFEDVNAVYARGLPARFGALLESPFLYTPGDIVVPGLLTVTEVDDLAAAVAPRPLWLEGLVDGLNRTVAAQQVETSLQRARDAYAQAGAPRMLEARSAGADAADLVEWVRGRL